MSGDVRRRGGRPRDPEVTERILQVSVELLATTGELNADKIAAFAGVGKAGIYRRWLNIDGLLLTIVRYRLGVPVVDHSGLPGDVRTDLARILHAAVSTWPQGPAEVAVLPRIRRHANFQVAYLAGPMTRLVQEINVAEVRARHRGEPAWTAIDPVLAGVRLLQHEAMTQEQPPDLLRAAEVVKQIVLPGLYHAGGSS